MHRQNRARSANYEHAALRSAGCIAVAIAAASGSVGCGGLAAEDDTSPSTYDSYAQARASLNDATAALGGADPIQAVTNVAFSFTGTANQRGQSASPDGPYDVAPISGRSVFEAAGTRSYSEVETTFRGGLHLVNRRVVDAAGGWNYRPVQGELTELSSIDANINKAFPGPWPPRMFPHALVRLAGQRAASLRWLGRSTEDGQVLDRIVFSDVDGTLITLAIDADTKLPAKVEGLATDILVGDALNEILFADYRPVDGVQIPFRYTFTVNGENVTEWRLQDVTLNADIDSTLWEPPPGSEMLSWTPRWQPQWLADGVYAVRMWSGSGFSYNTLFVEFDDFVVAIEAPLTDLLYQVTANLVPSASPGKPIRYVVPTHYHFDHTGGLKAYMAQGATVVAPPQTAEFVRRMAAAPHTLAPNPLLDAGIEPKVEVYVDSTTISDGTRELKLYQIGPSPHVDEVAIAWLPAEKVLFVTDLFTIPESGRFPPPSEALRHFAAVLGELGLDVETFVPGHGKVGTTADLERALAD